MNEETFYSIAHRRALSFSVICDIHSHIEVSGSVNINVAVACAGLDNRNGSVFYDSLNEVSAASWDKDVHIAIELHESGSSFP